MRCIANCATNIDIAVSKLDFALPPALASPGSYFASKSKAMGDIEGHHLPPKDRVRGYQ
jgi:hypothetical protein